MRRGIIMATKISSMSPQERITQIASTLAIENLFLDKETLHNLILVATNKKSPDDAIRELNKEYGL